MDTKSFPKEPGVYLMKDREETILYVGKAKNLRTRIGQYFKPGRDGRAMVPYLTSKVVSIDTIVVTSEKEALILENNLIKKHQPKYNALLKDDKTYFSLMINHKHMWPMVKVVRFKGKAPKDNLYFGPYTQGFAAKQTLEILQHLFPLRQCSDRELVNRTRPCILYEMKQCIAPCVSKCTKEEYDDLVSQVINFLKGHDKAIVKKLKQEMKKASELLEFERADQIHKTLLYIEATLEQQKVEKAGSKDTDVLGIHREGEDVAIAQLLFREGKLIGSQCSLFHSNAQSDEALLSSYILQTYAEKSELPKEIVVSHPLSQSVAEIVAIHVVCPKRGNKKALLEMARINAKAKFEKEASAQKRKEQLLLKSEETFGLTSYPQRIECFDSSNLSGAEAVSAMVVYTDGEKNKKAYRKYKIRTADTSDDYGMLREVLKRRFAKAREDGILPNLLLIDGGKGHLNVALSALFDLDISTVDVLAISKEGGRHDKGVTLEQIHTSWKEEPICLPSNSSLLFFLQNIRDETHRFAITFGRERIKKKSLASELDNIPCIGPTKKKRLLTYFGSVKQILAADASKWIEVQGITRRDCETLSLWQKDKLGDEKNS